MHKWELFYSKMLKTFMVIDSKREFISYEVPKILEYE